MSVWFKIFCFATIAMFLLVLSKAVWNGPISQSKVVQPAYVNALGMEFVKVPAGTFEMGSDRTAVDGPTHSVTLSSFYMMSTEVTNRQFSAFKTITRPRNSDHDLMPVLNITRKEMDEFISWLSKKDGRKYSLPTEAQWEYAARGGTNGLHFPWGDNFDSRRANAGPANRSEGQATRVKSYPPNQYGLYDMIGNAAETVYDGYYYYTESAEVDPKRDPPKKILSGIERGSGIGSYWPWVWYRMPYDQDDRSWGVGFRLVVELDL